MTASKPISCHVTKHHDKHARIAAKLAECVQEHTATKQYDRTNVAMQIFHVVAFSKCLNRLYQIFLSTMTNSG